MALGIDTYTSRIKTETLIFQGYLSGRCENPFDNSTVHFEFLPNNRYEYSISYPTQESFSDYFQIRFRNIQWNK